MAQVGDNKTQMTELEKDLLPLNVLLHCRTVVEGKNFVTTGVMTHVEGELFEVELHEFEQFELGEAVKLTIYSPAGRQSMASVVFAKYEGVIAVLQPPELRKRFTERRENPRVEIAGTAQILGVMNEMGEQKELESPSVLAIHDISISGINLSGQDAHHLAPQSRLAARIEIGIGFNCELEIVRRERQEDDDEMRCGAIMRLLEPEMLRPLRALILRQQVEMNAQSRRELIQKRSFNRMSSGE